MLPKQSDRDLKSAKNSISSLRSRKTYDPKSPFRKLIPCDLAVAVGERPALRTGRGALKQQQRFGRNAVEIEIRPRIGRLAVDLLPTIPIPVGEHVFVSGIQIVAVAATKIDDIGDVDGTTEIEPDPNVVDTASAEKGQRIVVVDSRGKVHLILRMHLASAADQLRREPSARSVVKDQFGHVAPALVGGAQPPVTIGAIGSDGMIAGQRETVARKFGHVGRVPEIGGVGDLNDPSGDLLPVLVDELIDGVFPRETDRAAAVVSRRKGVVSPR